MSNACYKKAGWVKVNLTAWERDAWHRAAVSSRLSISDWIRQAVNLNLEWHEYKYEELDGQSRKD